MPFMYGEDLCWSLYLNVTKNLAILVSSVIITNNSTHKTDFKRKFLKSVGARAKSIPRLASFCSFRTASLES